MKRLTCYFFLVPASFLIAALGGCAPDSQTAIVVYTSQDQVYATPILDAFTDKTGIRVRPVYDSEAVKTVGLANRLLAERDHPQCDVFWSNEELRTRLLESKGVFSPDHEITRFGFRSRRMVVNTNQVAADQQPASLLELTNAAWRGRVALAYPLFGTTSAHFLALRQEWGHAAWESWCQALVANKAFVVDGNSVVVQLVGRGEAWIGLTDFDDIVAGQKQGYPIRALPTHNETMIIANTAGIVAGGPNPAGARAFVNFISSEDIVEKLIEAGSLEGRLGDAPLHPTVAADWPSLLQDLKMGTENMQAIFLR